MVGTDVPQSKQLASDRLSWDRQFALQPQGCAQQHACDLPIPALQPIGPTPACTGLPCVPIALLNTRIRRTAAFMRSRSHAPFCGPTLWLERLGDGPAPATADAAETAAQLLLNGAIIAVKGIGGFHDRGRSGTPG